MKKKNFFLILILSFSHAPLFGSDEISISEFKKYIQENNTVRLSGSGIFIRTVFEKTKAPKIDSKQDNSPCTLERLQYSQGKLRREYAALSEEMGEKILGNPNLIDNIALKTCVYDEEKTVWLQDVSPPDGSKVSYGTIDSKKPYFPQFWNYGDICDEKSISDLIEKGSIIRQSVSNEQVHVILESHAGAVKLKWTFERDKAMSVSYIGLWLDNKLEDETIYQNFKKLDNGEWFPLRYARNKYTHVDGRQELIHSELIDAVSSSVEFNSVIDPSIFSLKFPDGTRVVDFRSTPPLSYTIEQPSLDVFVEPIIANDSNDSISNPQKGVFLPISDLTKKKLKLSALDVASGKLVVLSNSPETLKELHNSPAKIGKGDILWDGTLITIRDANINTVKQKYTVEHASYESYNKYELPQKASLPFPVLLTTKEGQDYLLSIYKIENNGIWVTCTAVSSDKKVRK